MASKAERERWRREGRPLTQEDIRYTFARLWLGRVPDPEGEDWGPGPEGMPPAEIAALVGKSPGWASQMKAYVMVHHVTGVDLGLVKSYALAKLDPTLWHGFVWDGEALRRVARSDGELVTIPELTLKEVEQLVDEARKG